MITVAGSRVAGKGVSVIIPNLIFYPGSVFAIDPKGELASITARRSARDLGAESVCLGSH
jgi:type IV secretion system protein VirD4